MSMPMPMSISTRVVTAVISQPGSTPRRLAQECSVCAPRGSTVPSDAFGAVAMVDVLMTLWNYSSVALAHSTDAYGAGVGGGQRT
eukprot:5512863-Prymnesium_polylepis.1